MVSRCNMIGHRRLAVDDDTQFTGRLLDWNTGRQDGHIGYVVSGKQILGGARVVYVGKVSDGDEIEWP